MNYETESTSSLLWQDAGWLKGDVRLEGFLVEVGPTLPAPPMFGKTDEFGLAQLEQAQDEEDAQEAERRYLASGGVGYKRFR